MRVADDQIGDHAHVIVGGEPVLRRQLIGGIAHDRVEAAAEDGTLAGEDGQAIRAAHLHRSPVDLVAIKDAFFRCNPVVAHIVPTDQDVHICTASGRIKCSGVVLPGLIRDDVAVTPAGGSERETGMCRA